jgi:hypothetical protein
MHNHKVYQEISEALCSKYSADKCHDKWTYLERRYREVVKNDNRLGRGRQTFLYFEQMDCVLGKSVIFSLS